MNLLSKPMHTDETGVTIVHKPGKVVAELGRHYVYSVVSTERGQTHAVISCVSASGFVLPRSLYYLFIHGNIMFLIT